MRMLIVADDLTGAGDSGVQMVKRGYPASVIFQPDTIHLHSLKSLILDTNSRELNADEAFVKVKEMVRPFVQSDSVQFDIVFKKIDSVLRGNVGAEIKAVREVFEPDLVLIAPAFPAKQRVIKNGIYFVDHQLLHQTEMFNDVRSTKIHSNVPQIISEQLQEPVDRLTYDLLEQGINAVIGKLRSVKTVICDTRNIEDLHVIVQASLLSKLKILWVGSAGLASGIVNTLPFGSEIHAGHPPMKRILTVIGSLNSVSRAQLNYLRKLPDEFELIEIPIGHGHVQTNYELIDQLCTLSHRANHLNKAVVLYSSDRMNEQDHGKINTTEIARFIGEITSNVILKLGFEGLVLTGGETARQILNSLNVTGIEILNEIETGVPFGITNGERQLNLIMKSGSFGDPGLLFKCISYLKGGMKHG